MTTRDELILASVEDPDFLRRKRHLARLALADMLEEEAGQETPASVALRWMAERNLWPSQGAYSGLMTWRWWSPVAIGAVAEHRLPAELYDLFAEHRLPAELYDLFPDSVGTLGLNYPTPLEAITALGEVILRYRAGERFVEEQEGEVL